MLAASTALVIVFTCAIAPPTSSPPHPLHHVRLRPPTLLLPAPPHCPFLTRCAIGNPSIADATKAEHVAVGLPGCSRSVSHYALLPLRHLVWALSHPVLYPIASVSYTGYLLQARRPPLTLHRTSSHTSAAPPLHRPALHLLPYYYLLVPLWPAITRALMSGADIPLAHSHPAPFLPQGITMNALTVFGWAGEESEWKGSAHWLFPVAFLANSVLGLVFSLVVERPAMNLLNMLAP